MYFQNIAAEFHLWGPNNATVLLLSGFERPVLFGHTSRTCRALIYAGRAVVVTVICVFIMCQIVSGVGFSMSTGNFVQVNKSLHSPLQKWMPQRCTA